VRNKCGATSNISNIIAFAKKKKKEKEKKIEKIWNKCHQTVVVGWANAKCFH